MHHEGLRSAMEKDCLCKVCCTPEMIFKSPSLGQNPVYDLLGPTTGNYTALGDRPHGRSCPPHTSLACSGCVAVFWRELQSNIQSPLDQPCLYAYLQSQPRNFYSEASTVDTSYRSLLRLTGVLQLRHVPWLWVSNFLLLLFLFSLPPSLWDHKKAGAFCLVLLSSGVILLSSDLCLAPFPGGKIEPWGVGTFLLPELSQ